MTMSSRLRFISCICLALAGLVTSCKKDEKPKGVLSHDEMTHLLTDIYIIENKAEKTGVPHDSFKIVFDSLKARLFEQKGISDSLFKASFDYYAERPKELEVIYTVMIDSISLKEQQLEASTVQPP
jgi:Domain of unknown function (DUF4296)